MFKKVVPKFSMSGASGGLVTVQSKEFVQDGVKRIERVLGDPKEVYPDLPSPENFSLQAQLDAGVTLNPVDCRLIPASDRAVADASVKLSESLTPKVDDVNE